MAYWLRLACAVLSALGAADTADTPGDAARSLLITSSTDDIYSDVLVKRINDTLVLTCRDAVQLASPDVQWYLPSYVSLASNASAGARVTVVRGRLEVAALRASDRGLYMCGVPGHNVSKYVVVQPPPEKACSLGGFTCGHICVMPLYVCDGRPDCPGGEDETPDTCGTTRVCQGKLNCPEGRCIAPAWCERGGAGQHSCCQLHAAAEPPVLGEPLLPRPDYGLIQSTIYTVTACALIFMVAVVLLVSAICKMHMKRAALRRCAYPPRYTQYRPVSDVVTCDGECSGARPRDSCMQRLQRRLAPGSYRCSRHGCGERGCEEDDSVTLRLGPLRISVPRYTRTRPHTHIDIHPQQLQMLSCEDTYTLNGRTIRLLGAQLCSPVLVSPPPYCAVPPRAPHKALGPPPEYLSREDLSCEPAPETAAGARDCNGNPEVVCVSTESAALEPPPGYEERGDINGNPQA